MNKKGNWAVAIGALIYVAFLIITLGISFKLGYAEGHKAAGMPDKIIIQEKLPCTWDLMSHVQSCSVTECPACESCAEPEPCATLAELTERHCPPLREWECRPGLNGYLKYVEKECSDGTTIIYDCKEEMEDGHE